MQVFVIDPVNQTISPAEYTGDYTEIYTLGGFDCFAVATFNDNRDGVFVDDEGLFKQGQAFFEINGYPQPLAGRGVVMGCDDEGQSVEPSVTLDWLNRNVVFLGYSPRG